MPEYLATSRSLDGRKHVENVVADSADEADRLLRAQGAVDVTLHDDDLSALFARRVIGPRPQLSAADHLMLRDHTRGLGAFLAFNRLIAARASTLLVLGAAGLAASFLIDGIPAGFRWLCAITLLMPSALAAFLVFKSRAARAKQLGMMDALYDARWELAIRRADRAGSRMPPHLLALTRAGALAGMGRVDEALAVAKGLADGDLIPEWYHRTIVAQVLVFAKRPDAATRELERAVDLAPGNATMMVGLARHVIWHERDARKARDLVARAREHALSDLLVPMIGMIDGLILLEEARPRDALPTLEAARRTLHARRHMPLGYLWDEQAMLALALTHAEVGDLERARKLYRKVRPRLARLGSTVLGRADRAILGPTP